MKIRIGKSKKTIFWMLISKIKRTNTSVFNFAKLKNKAVSVEKKVVHVHLNGNIPKKSNNRVLSSSKWVS